MVELFVCAQTRPGHTCTPIASSSDPATGSDWRKTGMFKYYAGPVTVPGRGHCILAHGFLYWKGTTYTMSTVAVHGLEADSAAEVSAHDRFEVLDCSAL